MKLKKLILFFGLLLSSLYTQAQIENVLVEKYYISDDFDGLDTTNGHLLPGSVTYRIYIDLAQGSKLLRIYGDENHPFIVKSTETIYNHEKGKSFGRDFLNTSTFSKNTLAVDSWLTLGQIFSTTNNQTYYGIPKDQDTDGSFVGGGNNDGGINKIPFGLLNNSEPDAGVPLFKKDGIQLANNTLTNWGNNGIISNAIDSTIFGSFVKGNTFESSKFYLKNDGTTGPDSVKNQILIAQVTTAGEISFAINVEVLEMINGIPTKVKYVSNDSILNQNGEYNEKFSKFLKYPFTCGCIDQNYVEFNPKAVCSDLAACKTKIILGCTDPKACNYDPTANVMVHNLCCYPGSCNNRDIAEVCPSLLEESLTFEIHPNPSHNYLYINAKTGKEETMSYDIYDVFGNNIHTKTIGNRSVLIDEEVNIENLPNGIYHLRLSVGNSVESKTFIKN
jgi:hypothetical protein